MGKRTSNAQLPTSNIERISSKRIVNHRDAEGAEIQDREHETEKQDSNTPRCDCTWPYRDTSFRGGVEPGGECVACGSDEYAIVVGGFYPDTGVQIVVAAADGHRASVVCGAEPI